MSGEISRQQRRQAARKADKLARPAAAEGVDALTPEAVEAALTEALGHHGRGALDEAERLYRHVLTAIPDQSDALHLLGFLVYQKGDPATAAELIGKAVSLNPDSAEAYNNLGLALQDCGRIEEAEAAYRHAIGLRPDMAEIHANLGTALEKLDRTEDAVACYHEALRLRPDNPDALCNLAGAQRRLGRAEEAVAGCRQALALNESFPLALRLLGLALGDLGRDREAADSLRRALTIAPNYAEAHGDLANLLGRMGRLGEAEASAHRATELKPDYSPAWVAMAAAAMAQLRFANAEATYRHALKLQPERAETHVELGHALQAQGRVEDAAAAYRHALELTPGLTAALGSLASLFEETNRLEAAKTALSEGLDAAPQSPLLHLVAARCDRREGRLKEAIARLEQTAPAAAGAGLDRDFRFELGRLFDRTGDADKAFASFVAGNRLATESLRYTAIDKANFGRRIEALDAFAANMAVDSWTPTPDLKDRQSPVFVIGFPRSGTTLVAQILNSHPRLQTLDEVPALPAVAVATGAGTYPDALGSLTRTQIAQLREVYFRHADAAAPPRPQVGLVDKRPLNICDAALIQRLFPTAKLILVLRHPMDACLSCFMQDSLLNDAMANFLTLEDTAACYVRIMGLWQQYARRLSLPCHVVKYEDLVGDFEGETRRLLAFLEVGWDDGVRDFADHHQRAEPVYERAVRRWHRYAGHLSPIMETLQPLVAQFGYEAAPPD